MRQRFNATLIVCPIRRCSDVNFAQRKVLIAGVRHVIDEEVYVLVLNFLLPKNVLPMHCSPTLAPGGRYFVLWAIRHWQDHAVCRS